MWACALQVILAHRPLYCSYNWSSCCWNGCDTNNSSQWQSLYASNAEALLVKYRVDFYLNGHTHNYERTYPGQAHARHTMERCRALCPPCC